MRACTTTFHLRARHLPHSAHSPQLRHAVFVARFRSNHHALARPRPLDGVKPPRHPSCARRGAGSSRPARATTASRPANVAGIRRAPATRHPHIRLLLSRSGSLARCAPFGVPSPRCHPPPTFPRQGAQLKIAAGRPSLSPRHKLLEKSRREEFVSEVGFPSSQAPAGMRQGDLAHPQPRRLRARCGGATCAAPTLPESCAPRFSYRPSPSAARCVRVVLTLLPPPVQVMESPGSMVACCRARRAANSTTRASRRRHPGSCLVTAPRTWVVPPETLLDRHREIAAVAAGATSCDDSFAPTPTGTGPGARVIDYASTAVPAEIRRGCASWRAGRGRCRVTVLRAPASSLRSGRRGHASRRGGAEAEATGRRLRHHAPRHRDVKKA